MQNPQDAAFEINLRAKQRLAERFQEELFSIASDQHIDVCRYRLIPNTEEVYDLIPVARSLERFQELFSLTYDALSRRPRPGARIGAVLAGETALEFGYSYSGSLGIVLVAKGSRGLFFGKFDSAIETINDVLRVNSRTEILEFARTLGTSVIKRAYDWSLENFKGDFSVDLTWRQSSGRYVGGVIDRSQIARNVDLIGLTSEEEISTIEVLGILVGIDIKTRSFHFVVPDGESYRGQLGPEFPTVGTIEVGQRYRAQIAVRTTTRFATDSEERRFTLLSLRVNVLS